MTGPAPLQAPVHGVRAGRGSRLARPRPGDPRPGANHARTGAPGARTRRRSGAGAGAGSRRTVTLVHSRSPDSRSAAPPQAVTFTRDGSVHRSSTGMSVCPAAITSADDAVVGLNRTRVITPDTYRRCADGCLGGDCQRVLPARGSDLERERPLGVARQLFDPDLSAVLS